MVKTRRLSVKIPGGVDNGTQIRLSGEGEAGGLWRATGQSVCSDEGQRACLFRRANDTIHLELAVNVTQAALGDEVDVPTLDGNELMTIPAGTQTGDTIRLRGKGVPRLRRDGTTAKRGDQVVTIQVRTPPI